MKKILFLLSTWQEAYSQVILTGIEKAVKDLDVEIHVINVYGSEVEYLAKEVEVFQLADVRSYDGVLMQLNGVGTGDYLERYAAECVKYHIPAVSIDIPVSGIAYCGIDSYLSMYNMTEHLIKDHHKTRLHYIGGPEDHPDSVERGRAFLDCLRDNHLEPYGFSYYGFMRSSGRTAYEEIKATGKPLAEAYVCANDFNALGFCLAAKEDGLEPPKDFVITGFDNQPEGRNYIPRISSVDRNLEGLGCQSLHHLVDIIDGRADAESRECISGVVTKGGSCGCVCDQEWNLADQYSRLNNMLMDRNANDSLQKSARDRLCGNDTFEQYQEELRKCISNRGLVDFRICVSHDLLDHDCTRTEGYDDIVDVYGANTYTQMKRSEGLIPKDFRDDVTKIYWLGTLHCKEKTLGYSVFKYSSALMEYQYHRTLNETAALAVENIKQAERLSEVNKKLESLYTMDPLTGLYNRFGYNTFAADMYEKYNGRIYIAFMDMDNLKTMNDDYGHNYGDIALKGIAEAINHVYTDTDVKVRMGGDEFLVVGPYVDEAILDAKEKQISEYLDAYSVRMNFPIPIGVSMGHSFCNGNGDDSMSGIGLDAMLQKADAKMYEQKQTKKNSRK